MSDFDYFDWIILGLLGAVIAFVIWCWDKPDSWPDGRPRP